MFESILENLTPSQYAAVTHKDGPMLVIAGAGSGKTRVVTRRIAWLMSQGVRPSSILAMTFTNKAAREMRQRVEDLTGDTFQNIGTFHSICARFLRRDMEIANCGRTHGFTIYDDDEQEKIVTQCILEKDLKGVITPKNARNVISECKNRMMSVEQLVDLDRFAEFYTKARQFQAVMDCYEERMRKCNAVDFDDLLAIIVRMLSDNEDVRLQYQNRYRYILVDEYQDTNHLQYELVRLLGGTRANVHVTGDPDQSIYSWRGADYRNIMDFEKDYAQATIIKLEQNYRSTSTILDAANALIRNNKWRYDKQLVTDSEAGAPIVLKEVNDQREEAQWICRRIRQLRKDGANCRDVAVFYRKNSQSRALEEEIVRQNIPYQLIGGVRYYERREVRDFLAVLRLIANECDEMALQRVLDFLKCGIGPKTLSSVMEEAEANFMTLFAYLASDEFQEKFRKKAKLISFGNWCRKLKEIPARPVSEAVKMALELSGLVENAEKQYGLENLEERRENLRGLVDRACNYELDNPDGNLIDFLEDTALVADVDNHDPNADSISLMTLHSSKGLEFPYVFIAGMEDGTLPHTRTSFSTSEFEEERRLFYVGLTRAEKQVFLSYARQIMQYGGWDRCEPSRFLAEIPEELLEPEVTFDPYGHRLPRRRNEEEDVLDCFDEDQTVDIQTSPDSVRKADDDDEGLFYDYSVGDQGFDDLGC